LAKFPPRQMSVRSSTCLGRNETQKSLAGQESLRKQKTRGGLLQVLE
jgi:hypothetical protein